MHFTKANLRQAITYWGPGASNEFGHSSSAAPILIRGRWEEMNQQIRKANGEEIMSRAEVFVDRDLEIAGFLALGDYTAQSTPVADALEIQDFRITPDLRTLGSERRAYL